MNTLWILVLILFVILLVFSCSKRSSFKMKEGYRDPLYLNRAKMVYDWYPRANGSIYGFPYRYGGSWDLMSGYPYYDRAY